nr:ribonuclease H-like domain-containing protein [Tanacetum cinerariifolium]
MDTGVSSHVNDSVTSLSDVFNTCIYPSVSVGDGHTIPVTNTRHSILLTPHRSLHLNNVLITPHIVKHLIYVCQFVRDNSCTVEFDAFGFSVKDFMTRRVLLRCDSTRYLYPVTPPSPIHHAFLNSQHTWHQRRGHPGSEVLRRLVSRNPISCNKEKPFVLCHACQLGKHVRLPFLEGVDVDETFSPVVKPGTIRTVLSLATSRHWSFHQLDVKNAFLHGDLSETFYMHHPLGFQDPVHPDYVCLLQRRFISSLHQEFSMIDLGSLTNSLDTRDYVKIRTTLLSGHPSHLYIYINKLAPSVGPSTRSYFEKNV